MTDEQFAKAEELGRALHEHLDRFGEDGDGFSEIFEALDCRYGGNPLERSEE